MWTGDASRAQTAWSRREPGREIVAADKGAGGAALLVLPEPGGERPEGSVQGTARRGSKAT